MVLTEATQWFKNGDHPQDESTPIDSGGGRQRLTEGKIVRFFRSLEIAGGNFCPKCGNVMSKHGLLEEGINNEEIICPGDYIVTRRSDRTFYRMPAGEFEAMYEPTRPPAPVVNPEPPTGPRREQDNPDPPAEPSS